MKKLLTLIVLLFIISTSILAQEYTLDLPNRSRSENLYLFTKTNNNYIYLVLLEQSQGKSRVLRHYKSLDKKTNTEKIHYLDRPILFQNIFLNIFHYENNLYFLNFKSKIKELEISSMSLTTNSLNAKRFNISLEKKEQVVSNYYKDGLLYIFTLEKKSKSLNVYTLSVSDGAVEKTSTTMNRHDYVELELTLKTDATLNLIDYDNYNSIFNFTGSRKIFLDKNEVVFTIEHASVGLINAYHFDLSKKSTKRISLKKPNIGLNTLNITYFQGKLYRIAADRYELYVDIIDIETEEKKVFEKSHDSDYPFDFQSSNLVDQDLKIIESNKQALHRIGNRMSFIYPEVDGDETSIYLGSVLNPNRSRELIGGLIMVVGVAATYYSGGGFSPFFIRFPASNIEEKDLNYVLMKTNFTEDLGVKTDNHSNESVNSIILKQRKAILEMTSDTGMKNISIQKFDGKYYGVYYIGETEKLLIKEINL